MDIIQSFWYSKDLTKNHISTIEVLCIASYLAHGHIFHLYTYNPPPYNNASMEFLLEQISKVPHASHFEIKDAAEILSQKDIFFDNRGSVGIAAFSDYFRYNLIYKKGGWWVDMDTICLRPLVFKSPYVFASQRNSDSGTMATTCMIKGEKKSAFFKTLINDAQKEIRQDLKNKQNLKENIKDFLRKMKNTRTEMVTWGIIGPWFLDAHIIKEGYEEYIYPPNCFCEVDWFHAERLLDPNYKFSSQEAYVVHIWNAIWEDFGYSKNSSYPKGCMIEGLKDQYLVQNSH